MITNGTTQPWTTPIPLAEIDSNDLRNAEKLMKALLPSIERRANWNGSETEFLQAGCSDYARVFGHTITAQGFRYLYERTITRNAGQGSFSRLELFLSDRVKRQGGGRAMLLVASESDFAELHDKIARWQNPAEPTSIEEAELWTRAIELYNALVDGGTNATRTKYALLSFLWRHAPPLAKTQNALRVMFDRRLAEWIRSDDGSLRDRRELRKGVPIARAFSPEDIDIIVWHTVRNCGGRISQGVRECILGKAKRADGTPALLTPQMIAACTRHNSGKSYVPTRLREVLTPQVRRIRPLDIGGRYANDHRATMEVDYSASFSDDIYSADDITLCVEVFMRDPSGEVIRDEHGKAILVRGQALVFVDVRSRRVLGYSLQPERNYNQWGIRTNAKNVMRDFAVPRFWLWEKNIWERSRLLTGGRNWRQRTNDECQEGLRRFGCRFIFTPTPQGKAVMERIAGLLQDRMEGERGYTGRNERVDKPQRTKDAERLVRSGADPAQYFYEFNEWHQRFGEIIEEYNQTKQDGALDGLSPAEAYVKFQNLKNPPKRYSPEIAFQLSYEWKRVSVTKDGIRFDVGNQRFIYCGEVISHLSGQEVLAGFDPSDPSELIVTDLNQRNAIAVERFIPQSPTAAYDHPEDFRRELAKVRGQDAWPKIRYRTLKDKYEVVPRPIMTDRQFQKTAALGQEIEQQRAAIQSRRNEFETRRTRAQRKAQRLKMPAAIIGQHGDEDEYLQMRLDAQRQAEKETNL
jgi:hypothetical protein